MLCIHYILWETKLITGKMFHREMQAFQCSIINHQMQSPNHSLSFLRKIVSLKFGQYLGDYRAEYCYIYSLWYPLLRGMHLLANCNDEERLSGSDYDSDNCDVGDWWTLTTYRHTWLDNRSGAHRSNLKKIWTHSRVGRVSSYYVSMWRSVGTVCLTFVCLSVDIFSG